MILIKILIGFFLFAFVNGKKITLHSSSSQRTFEIDISGNRFLKDGVPFRYISGTVQYFRTHPDDWRDRLNKLKHAGCNAVETYVEWSSHEPESGVYNFEGFNDLLTFFDLAHELELVVILRPGPFIDAERDMGGLPYWLLRENPKMKLRSMDSSYITFVDRWFNVLFPMLIPYLYHNGGPIVMIQVENEYGSYDACDFYYTAHLRDLTREILGDQIALFTTDGPTTSYLKCGKIADVYATIDFGPGTNVANAFHAQRAFQPQGPLVNSEYYPGWLDHWGDPHSTTSSDRVVQTLDEMLAMNASVNIYVFVGGTSFGMTAGSNLGSRFQACPTSYDYDALLTEAGDVTEKYYAIRNVTQKYVTLPPGPVPSSSLKSAYGEVDMSLKAGILELKEMFESVSSQWPQTFEALSVSNGIVIYSTTIPQMIPDPARLSLFDIHDRGYVFVDNEFAGIVSREQEIYELSIYGQKGQTLTIVVESQGRICYGSQINDFKGIMTDVTIGSLKLENWEMTALPLLNTSKIQHAVEHLHQKSLRNVKETVLGGMAFYDGVFDVLEEPTDTFLRLDGWTKGYAWINDFLLGRYWPVVGPQVTLYIPRSLLKLGQNTLMVLELEKSPCAQDSSCKVSLVHTPEIDGPTPVW